MKAKTQKRLLAEQLRLEQRLSYSEISEQLGISKSALSGWWKQLGLTPEQEERIQQRIESHQSVFVAHARQVNQGGFQQARAIAFQTGVNVAANL